MKTKFLTLLAAAVVVVAMELPAGAATGATHCGVNAIGVKKTGELITGPQACFATMDELVAYFDQTRPAGAAPQSIQSALTTFYDGHSPSGTSFSVTFACSSGYLNFTNYGWNDRVSYVATSCSYVALYYNVDLGGSRYPVYGSGSLSGTGMDNAASSAGIAYA